MSQPLEIVHKETHGYTESGVASRSTESYIKLSTEFRRGPLAFFSGAQLKVFLCVAFHEADDEPGASLSTIMRESGLSKPTAIAAARFLLDDDHPFIKIVGTELDGTRLFRVCKLAWCGKDPARGGGKKSLPLAAKHLPRSPVVVGTDSSAKAEPASTTANLQSPITINPLGDIGKGLPIAPDSSLDARPALIHGRTREERNRIRDALWDLGIETEEAYAKILGDAPDLFRGRPRDYSHVTPEYVEDWVAHYHRVGQRAGLGPGYYRTQIREQRQSPYRMTAAARAEYRAANDAEWEKENS